jgi:hypothetical protein
MKILKSLFILSISLFALTAKGQVADNQQIQTRLDAFIDLTNQKNYYQAFDLMYPKMFSQISKQDLIDLMSSTNADGLSFQISNRRNTSYSAPFRDGNEDFVKVNFTADMEIQITPGSAYDHPKPAAGMLQQFQATYGSENVKFDQEAKKYTISTDKAMMAVRENGGEWHLVEINPDQMDLMKALFSEPVIKALVMVE